MEAPLSIDEIISCASGLQALSDDKTTQHIATMIRALAENQQELWRVLRNHAREIQRAANFDPRNPGGF